MRVKKICTAISFGLNRFNFNQVVRPESRIACIIFSFLRQITTRAYDVASGAVVLVPVFWFWMHFSLSRVYLAKCIFKLVFECTTPPQHRQLSVDYY